MADLNPTHIMANLNPAHIMADLNPTLIMADLNPALIMANQNPTFYYGHSKDFGIINPSGTGLLLGHLYYCDAFINPYRGLYCNLITYIKM